MDKRSLATDIDKLRTEFLSRLAVEKEFDKAVFDKLIDKLYAYALLTRDQPEIDRRVASCLFRCYEAFQHYFNQPGKKPVNYDELLAAHSKIVKLRTRVLQNVGW